MASMKKNSKKQESNKSLNYATNRQTPFKRGNFETRQRFNTVTPKLRNMTHDFLFRNVYKKPQPLSDEKRNHPTSHYRYKFHHSNSRKHIDKDASSTKKHHKKHAHVAKTEETDDIPFYDDIDKSKKEYLSDNELDIASSSNDDSSDDELSYENFRKDSLKRKHVNKKLTSKSKWLQSKIRENSELFVGGLDLQGRVPYRNTIKKKKYVSQHSLVLGSIHSIHEHFVRLYLYGSIPATLTIREVSDVLSMEIDHLITNKKGAKKSLLHIKSSLQTNALIAQKRGTQSTDMKYAYHYSTLEELPTCYDIFKRHQIIRCIVTHKTERDGYHVSLRPSLFNAKLRMNDLITGYALLCSIKSIEDKGYVIDTGIYVQDKGGVNEIAVRSFMNYKDVDPKIISKIIHKHKGRDEEVIPIGYPLELIVKSTDIESNSVWFTLDFKKYYRELTVLPVVPIVALKPGFVVQCFVKKILADGLVLEFAKVYQGVVPYSHVDKLMNKAWKRNYKIGQQIHARIVLVHPDKNIIHLSIKPHLVEQLEYQLLPNALSYDTHVPRRCNEIIKADVRRIAYDNLYLYTKLLDPMYVNATEDAQKELDMNSDDEEQQKLFPALNKEPLQQMIPIRVTEKHLGKGSLSNPKVFDSWRNRCNVQVKLLRFDAFQGEFQGTLKGSEVKARVLFYKDVKYGMVFECTVQGMNKKKHSIDVTFCNGLLGHISLLHLAEKPPKSLDEPHIVSKYKVGNVIKCRVLTCIAYKKSVNLTAKPSLVENDVHNKDPMTVYSWNTPNNVISRGVVYKLNDVMGYIAVHFYNSVTAIIPSKDLKANGYLGKVSDEFYMGQTIQVRVGKCMQVSKRMICSMNLNTEDDSKGDNALYDGTLFWSKIVSKKDDCFIVKKLSNYDENASDLEDEEMDEDETNEISFDELKLYSILPFDHLCDNSAQSMHLVESNAFEIGDKIQVLTMHRIKVTRPDIEKQLNFQTKMIESLGLSPDVVQFKKTDKKILSIVTAKTGLLRLYRKKLTPKVCPINTRQIEVGDEVMGCISSDRFPSIKHALWVHFSGLLQLPVSWKNMHDLHKLTVTECIKMSFAGNACDHMDLDFCIYKQGDLVMAKVMDIRTLPTDEEGGRHLVTLSMKPSDLYPHIPLSRQSFFCKTFINEWYLSYKQQQALFLDSNDEDSDSDEEMSDEQAKQDAKAVLDALHIGMVLQCRVKNVDDKNTVIVDFVPPMEGVNGVIKLNSSFEKEMYKQRLADHRKFKCNVMRIDWDAADIPTIELYDAPDDTVLHTVQDAAAHTFVIATRTMVEKAKIIYVSTTYVLVEFGVESSESRQYIGIVPMRLPYLIIPTALLFHVGDEIDAVVIQASNHYGGLILCSLDATCLTRYIRAHNKKRTKAMYSKKKSNKDVHQKRKLERRRKREEEEPPAKKRKLMNLFIKNAKKKQDSIASAKSNVLGTVYTATLIESDADSQQFIVNVTHKRLPAISGGILPYEQLCDSHATSMQLAASYDRVLQTNDRKSIALDVIILRVDKDNEVIFTAKNMIVSHCGNHGYPRFNAYQIRKKYNQIRRNVAMMGCIERTANESDVMTVSHGNGMVSNVDYNDGLMLPFDRKEISMMYPKGQSVIGHLNTRSKLKKGGLSMQLCKLKKIESIDIMVSNQSFITEYQRMVQAKYIENNTSDGETQCVTHLDVNIGDVIDVRITNVRATCIEFEYDKEMKGTIIRPQHSGAELDEFEMNTEVLVIDIDYHTNQIFGSTRLSNKTPMILKQSEQKTWMNTFGNKATLAQLEWVSDDGYLVLQIIENKHFVVVPFATPYFHFTWTQRQLYFKIGAKFNVTITECIHLNTKHDHNKNVYLGYIGSWIKPNRGYLDKTMNDIIGNPSAHYKPYDTRFTHPAQIMYSSKPIQSLSIKLYETTAQGHVGEIAPGLYPKIVIAAPPQSDSSLSESYLIMEDKVDTNGVICVDIKSNANAYSNANREIVISVQDVMMDETETDKDELVVESTSALKVGQIVDIVIESISKHGIHVNVLGTKGFVEPIHATDSIKDIGKLQSNPESFLLSDSLNVMVGEQCKAVVIDMKNTKQIQLSLQKSMMKKYYKLQRLLTNEKVIRLDVGEELNGIVSKIVCSHGVFIDLGVFGVAELHISNAISSADIKSHQQINLESMFRTNDIVCTRVIGIDKETQMIHVSIKHLANPNYIETPLHSADVRTGSLVSGIVSMVDANLGVIVWLSRYIKARISLKHLNSISYEVAVQQYPVGRVIEDLSVLHVGKHIELSVTDIDRQNANTKSYQYKLKEMAVGDFVNVRFERRLSNGSLSVYVPGADFKYGVIPSNQISHDLLKNNQMIRGDKIQVWVFEVDEANKNTRNKVCLTMKSKSLKMHQSSADFSKQQMQQIKQEKLRRAAMNMMKQYKELQQKNLMNVDEDSDEEGDIKPLDAMTMQTQQTRKIMRVNESSSDEEEDVELTIQKEEVKAEEEEEDPATAEEEEEEENVEWNELMKSEGFGSKPRSVSDFERLLVGSPSSSIIWIEYIAFYLGASNVVRARNVIQRALKEIAVGAENYKERLNIWIAWMNLEMLYGTQEALIGVVNKALKNNDEADVYHQFVAVCEENNKYDLCQKYYTQMLHKLSGDSNVYVNYGRFLYEQFRRTNKMEYLEEARDLLKRAIQHLSVKTQHISLIQKFAWNELKYVGGKEGEAMFEGLLNKYHNKAMIWNTYALAVYRFTTTNRLQNARQIFERGLNVKNIKMQDTKWLFKQYLKFENKYGNGADDHKDNVAHIKQLAKQYVSSLPK